MSDVQSGPERPAEVKPEILALVRSDKKTIVREKDSKGRFISKKEKLSSERYEIERREFLQGKEPGSKLTRAKEIDRELFEMVKLGKTDPKFATAAVNAAKLLNERAHGRTAPSDKELDKLNTFPITAVFIPMPELMHPEVIDGDKPKEIPKPQFLDAEIVSTNE